MKYYKYKAVTTTAEVVRGLAQAKDGRDLNQTLSARGLTVLSYRKTLLTGLRPRARWTRKDLISFIFHLEQMLAAGIPVLESLREFSQATHNKHQIGVVDAIIDGIDNGLTLSKACTAQPEVFPPLVLSMIEAGEHSGRLEQTLGELGELLKWQDESIARLKRVMIYPAFVAAVLFAVMLFVMTWLVPGMVEFITVAGASLPLHTRVLIATSQLVSEFWLVTAVVLAGSIVLLRTMATFDKRIQSGLDRWKLRIPLLGPVMFKTRLARFSRCASMMYGAGINIVDALRYSKGTLDNRMMEAAVDRVGQSIVDGQGISGSFGDAKVFPPLVARILRVGESTGALDVSLNQLSYVYERESRELTEKLEQSLGPIMTVFVGLLMMWVVVSVIGPIYDLVFGIGGGQL